ncbi:unnamed protein product [Auanema sp. JU1783]|nr:unnamed protein product [Auanema sp. JU1783]
MREYKYILLVHVICFLAHDCVVCIWFCPRSYPALWAIRQLGLSADFGISLYVLGIFAACAITEVVGTYTHMLFFRTRVIITETHPLYFGELTNFICTTIFYTAWVVAAIGIFTFTTVDDDKKIEQLHHFNVCEKNYQAVVGTKNVLIAPYEYQSTILFILTWGIAFIIFIYLICFFVSTHTLYNSHTYLSRKTIFLQRSLLFALFLQVLIPLLLMLVPIMIVVASPPLEIEMAAFLVYAAHGSLNSIIIIFAHRDYRNIISVWFLTIFTSRTKKEPTNKITCIHKSESGTQYQVNCERL